jgi:hypothetical protein
MGTAIPFLKLAGLLVKTASKPIATRMSKQAGGHPKFSKACVGLGEGVHQITARLKVIGAGYSVVRVKPLPEETALKHGIDYLSESIILLIVGGFTIYEYQRGEEDKALKAQKSAEKAAKEAAALEARFAKIEESLREIRTLVEKDQVKRSEPNKQKENGTIDEQAREGSRSYWYWLFR